MLAIMPKEKEQMMLFPCMVIAERGGERRGRALIVGSNGTTQKAPVLSPALIALFFGVSLIPNK